MRKNKKLIEAVLRQIIILLVLISCSVRIPCGAHTQYLRSRQAYGKTYLYLNDIAKYYGMNIKWGLVTCSLYNKWTRITITFDKREAYLNGIKINFLFPPVIANSIPLISQQDFNNIIDPLLRVYSIPKQTIKQIVIDPGHGGTDKGASGKRNHEKDINIKIAKKLKSHLLQKGYVVYFTRESDLTLSLDARTAKCVPTGADLFISIHCNSTKNSGIYGIESYCLTPENAPSSSDSEPKSTFYTGNRFNKNNFYLAYCIHSKMLESTGAFDRGIKHARFAVLKSAPCPAILIETGFLSNYYEEALLEKDYYQWKLAAGIAEGISLYSRSLLGKK